MLFLAAQGLPACLQAQEVPGETGKDAWAYLIQDSGTGQQGHTWQPEAAEGCSRRRRLWRRRRLRGVREEQVGWESVPALEGCTGPYALFQSGQRQAVVWHWLVNFCGESRIARCSPPALELSYASGADLTSLNHHCTLRASISLSGVHCPQLKQEMQALFWTLQMCTSG